MFNVYLLATFPSILNQFQCNLVEMVKALASLRVDKQVAKNWNHPWKVTWNGVPVYIAGSMVISMVY